MDYGWLNIGSLALGLLAIAFPIINIMGYRKSIFNDKCIVSLISMSSCAISLGMQIFYANYLVNKEDFVAMMDLMSTVATVSALLIIITIGVNIISTVVCNKKTLKI